MLWFLEGNVYALLLVLFCCAQFENWDRREANLLSFLNKVLSPHLLFEHLHLHDDERSVWAADHHIDITLRESQAGRKRTIDVSILTKEALDDLLYPADQLVKHGSRRFKLSVNTFDELPYV